MQAHDWSIWGSVDLNLKTAIAVGAECLSQDPRHFHSEVGCHVHHRGSGGFSRAVEVSEERLLSLVVVLVTHVVLVQLLLLPAQLFLLTLLILLKGHTVQIYSTIIDKLLIQFGVLVGVENAAGFAAASCCLLVAASALAAADGTYDQNVIIAS